MGRSSFYWKRIGARFLGMTLVLVLSLSLLGSLGVRAEVDYYETSFEWEYDGRQWTWNLSIPKSLYEVYRNVPVSTRVRNGPEDYGFLATTNDAYMKMVAEKLNETAEQMGYGSYDEVSFVLAFVQSLPYTSDSVTSGYDEYPRFPIETLVDGGGDCEDTSILFATITLIMNYRTVYINPPDHLAVGVLGEDLPGSYYTYNERTYYYCETTGNGFKIGEIPDEFKDEKAYIYPIRESQQYDPSLDIIPYATPAPSLAPAPSATTSPTVVPTPPISFYSLFDSPTLVALIAGGIILIVVAVLVSASKRKKQQVPNNSAIPPQPIPEPMNIVPENTKFCRYCGSLNRRDASFCERCRRSVE